MRSINTTRTDRISETYTFGSETFNIPCSARYGSFFPSSSLLMYSALEPGRGKPNQNSTVSNESYDFLGPQVASTALQPCGACDMGSVVATVRRSRLCKVRKVLRNNESDQGTPAPSDAIVRDRTRGITRFILRNTGRKVSLSHQSNALGMEISYQRCKIPCNDSLSSNSPTGSPGLHRTLSWPSCV